MPLDQAANCWYRITGRSSEVASGEAHRAGDKCLVLDGAGRIIDVAARVFAGLCDQQLDKECGIRVHSSVVRAADCRSAGPWFKSGCALFRRAPLGRPQ